MAQRRAGLARLFTGQVRKFVRGLAFYPLALIFKRLAQLAGQAAEGPALSKRIVGVDDGRACAGTVS